MSTATQPEPRSPGAQLRPVDEAYIDAVAGLVMDLARATHPGDPVGMAIMALDLASCPCQDAQERGRA